MIFTVTSCMKVLLLSGRWVVVRVCLLECILSSLFGNCTLADGLNAYHQLSTVRQLVSKLAPEVVEAGLQRGASKHTLQAEMLLYFLVNLRHCHSAVRTKMQMGS